MYNQHANAKPLKHTFRSQLNGKNRRPKLESTLLGFLASFSYKSGTAGTMKSMEGMLGWDQKVIQQNCREKNCWPTASHQI